VALVRTDVSEEHIATIIRLERNSELGTTLATEVHCEMCSVLQLLVTANVPSSLIRFTLMMEAINFFETLLLIRVTLLYMPEDGILYNNSSQVSLCKWVISFLY
jgi:hypothetical protein